MAATMEMEMAMAMAMAPMIGPPAIPSFMRHSIFFQNADTKRKHGIHAHAQHAGYHVLTLTALTFPLCMKGMSL